MKHKPFIYSILIFFVFVGLVFYNYLLAQKAIRETRPAPLSLSLLSYPTTIKVGQPASFAWHVDASSDLSTPFTTIYWGYQSSPSALTKSDTPEAVRYPNFQSDYTSGSFRLPDSFDLNISFNRVGRVWFRAFAKVQGNNLWSAEKYLDVTQ